VQEWWGGHLAHVQHHHANENAIANPFIRARVKYPAKLQDDHVTLQAMLNHIDSKFQNDEVVAASPGPMLRTWRRYKAIMFPHLHEEEQVSLPLMRAYFTPAEVAPMVQRMLKTGTKVNLGSFFHHIPGGKRGVQAFMKQEGIPSFVWYLQFKVGTR
jgi:hypothetical protein